MTKMVSEAPEVYTHAKSLFICWNGEGDNHDRFKAQRKRLKFELQGYNYNPEDFDTDSVKPYRGLNKRLFEILEHDSSGTLLIVYYGGYREKNEDNQLIWLR